MTSSDLGRLNLKSVWNRCQPDNRVSSRQAGRHTQFLTLAMPMSSPTRCCPAYRKKCGYQTQSHGVAHRRRSADNPVDGLTLPEIRSILGFQRMRHPRLPSRRSFRAVRTSACLLPVQ